MPPQGLVMVLYVVFLVCSVGKLSFSKLYHNRTFQTPLVSPLPSCGIHFSKILFSFLLSVYWRVQGFPFQFLYVCICGCRYVFVILLCNSLYRKDRSREICVFLWNICNPFYVVGL